MTRIVVLGAGYTGMFCAIGVAQRLRRQDVQVTLVNPSARFTERLRMHQIATGQRLADHQITDVIAGTGIEFVPGWATSIDPDGREVTVAVAAGERTLPYDTLVYATGSGTDTSRVPGAAEHAFTLNSPQVAARMAERLSEIAADAGTFAVCGAGLTGVEAATEIAENFPAIRVMLLSRDKPGPMMNPKARGHLLRALRRLGIEVRSGVDVTKVLPDAVELDDGELVAADGTLWTTGVRVSPLAAEAGIATDEYGRILTDATLRSVSHPSVYAIGDAAAIRQAYGVIHGTCQSGVPTAAHAAGSIARQLSGKQPRAFRFGYVHQPVSLGRRDAVIQFTHADDTPRRWSLRGRLAVAYKEAVSSSPLKAYRLAKRLPISATAMSTSGGRRNRRLGVSRHQ